RLNQGDILQLYINDEFFNQEQENKFMLAPTNINIVYQDENIMLIDKKAGLVVHEDNENSTDTLINRTLHYLYEKGEYNPKDELSFTPALCNRIDRNTCGMVIVAKNAESLRLLNQFIKDREIRKFYLCVVDGKMPKKSDTLTHYLIKNEKENQVKIYDNKINGAKTIITKYSVLATDQETSLLEVELLTGRTHQIRAHLAYIGHPLIGDGKYGSNKINAKYKQKQQLLYSYKLIFDFKDTNNLLSYLKGKSFIIQDVWFKNNYQK
ncbi:MAG: RluA family pseudouridine synthase, partial [Oscillospiraceae bacterium]